MTSLLQDFRFGFRMLRKAPVFTAVAVITLGVGIGATTAIFSVVRAVLLKPLPYAGAERIMMIWESNPSKGFDTFAVSPANFLDWQKRSRTFETLVALQGVHLTLTGTPEPESLLGIKVTPGFFRLTGTQPALGRSFHREEYESGKGRVVVVSHAFWQRRLGGRPDALGKTLLLDGQRHTVVGVMSAGFRALRSADLLAPLALGAKEVAHRGAHYVSAMGKLAPGISPGQAGTEMKAIAADLAREYPDTDRGWTTRVVPLYEQVVGGVRPALLALFAAVGFVLIIACGNVASLLLARGSARKKEIALRSALGAGRGRLIRQLLAESLLLAGGGGILGALLGAWGIDLLRALKPANIPRMQEVGMDGTVLAFVLGASLLAGLLSGMMPALLVSRSRLDEALKEGGRGASASGRHRVRGALVVAQVALSLVLLVGAGLEVRSFIRLMEVDPGFNPSGVLSLSLSLPPMKYPDAQRRASFMERVLEKEAVLPGVREAALVSTVPFGDNDLIYSVHVEGRVTAPDAPELSANWYAVSPDYFRLMGIPVVRGRAFTARDNLGAPRVAVVNETLARKIFPGEDPLGKRIRMGTDPDAVREIVGVVKDVKHYGLDSGFTSQMYESCLQNPSHNLSVLLRTSLPPSSLTSAARRAVLAVDGDQPVGDVTTLEDLVAASASQRGFITLLIGFFAGVALFLASVGLYGLVAHWVTQRTHEFGVRLVLGARRRDVLGMALRQGMGLVALGVAVGLAAAVGLTRLISGMLYGVGALDGATFLGTPLVLSAAALLACYLPARRATRVDPAAALRCE